MMINNENMALRTNAERCAEFSKQYQKIMKAMEWVRDGLREADSDRLKIFETVLVLLERDISQLTWMMGELTVEERERMRASLVEDYKECEQTWNDLKKYEVEKHINPRVIGDMQLPTMESVVELFGDKQMKKYLKMERAGLRPKLQMTPLKCDSPALFQLVAGFLGIISTGSSFDIDNQLRDSNRRVNASNYLLRRKGDILQIFQNGEEVRGSARRPNPDWIVEIAPTVMDFQEDKKPKIDKMACDEDLVTHLVEFFNDSVGDGYKFLGYESFLFNLLNIKRMEKVDSFDLVWEQGRQEFVRFLLDEATLENFKKMPVGIVGPGCLRLSRCPSEPMKLAISKGLEGLVLSRTIPLPWRETIAVRGEKRRFW